MSEEHLRSPSARSQQQPASPLASMVVFVGVLPDFVPDAPPTENLNLAPMEAPTTHPAETPAALTNPPAPPPLPPRAPMSAAPPPPVPRSTSPVVAPPLPPILTSSSARSTAAAPSTPIRPNTTPPAHWRSFAAPVPRITPEPPEKIIPAPTTDSGEYQLEPTVKTTAVPKVVRAIFAKAHAQIVQQKKEEEPTDVEEAIEAAPPWLVSFVVHIAMLIALGLLATTAVMRKAAEHRQEVEVVYHEELGEQVIDDRFDFAGSPTATPTEKPAFSPSRLPPVDDPLAGYQTLAPLDSKSLGVNLVGNTPAPTVGLSFGGRQTGMKMALLGKYGGTATTEAAVHKGLEWLVRQQQSDGSWKLDGPYTNGAGMRDPVVATAMALIALQGAGNTHLTGEFKEQVDRGWKWLAKQQDAKGGFKFDRNDNKQMYSQAFATIALCELVGMTGDPKVRPAAELAIQFAVDAQDAEFGGWRYVPRQDSDTSVTGWVVMSLQSAKMARINVPSQVFDNVGRYLNEVQSEYGSKYGYQPDQPPSLTMTAEALLCRQYLGWKQEDDRLRAGVKYLRANLPDWGKRDVYYWYYATQVLRHMEGDGWKAWNEVMRELLPSKQEKAGDESGSWNPSGDRYGSVGGRLYVTCLSIYILEVYYRHMPLYSSPYQFTPPPEPQQESQPPMQAVSDMR